MRSEAEMNCIDSLNQFCFVFFSAYISEAETDTDDVASVVNQGCERERERETISGISQHQQQFG